MTQQAQPLPHEGDILAELRAQFELERGKWRAGVSVKFEIVLGIDGADVACVAMQKRRVKFRQ